jgi:hypothetical protein
MLSADVPWEVGRPLSSWLILLGNAIWSWWHVDEFFCCCEGVAWAGVYSVWRELLCANDAVEETVVEDEGKMIIEDQVVIYIDNGASRSVRACSRSVSACFVFGMSRTLQNSHFCPHCHPIKAVSLPTKTEAGIFNNEMASSIQSIVEHVLEERSFKEGELFRQREPHSKKEGTFKEREPFHRKKPFRRQKELSKKPSRVCV